jgi:uncharacterized protein YjbJ (UPF0337 family)
LEAIVAVKDRLRKLAQRSKEAEDNVQAAADKSRAELQSQVDQARDNAKEHADSLRATNAQVREDVSGRWAQIQDNWTQHVGKVREDVADRRAARDAREAERNADWAEGDAEDAVEFALAAIDEAEYAVLVAISTRADADELAAGRVPNSM